MNTCVGGRSEEKTAPFQNCMYTCKSYLEIAGECSGKSVILLIYRTRKFSRGSEAKQTKD